MLDGWKTNLTATITSVKVLVMDMAGVGVEQIGEIGNQAITLVGLALVIYFRELGKKKESLADRVQRDIDEMKEKLERMVDGKTNPIQK